MNNPDTIKIAYALSTRELAGEPLSATDVDLNQRHRGNLPHVYTLIFQHNLRVDAGEVDLPRVELVTIIYDDPEPPQREFTDLPIECVGICSARLLELRDARNVAQERGDTQEFERLRAAYSVERVRYEQELVDHLQGASVDVVLLDRLMVILGKTYLDNYLGNTLNTHPAILPDLPGDTPTADAHARAGRGGNPWTGVTAHFINRGIDTGPAIAQRECTFVEQGMSVEDVRRTNYRGEGRNFMDAVTTYLSDSDAIELILLRREARMQNGSGGEIRQTARRIARALMRKYGGSFDSHWQRRKEHGLGTGRYQYTAPFGKQATPVHARGPQRIARVAN